MKNKKTFSHTGLMWAFIIAAIFLYSGQAEAATSTVRVNTNALTPSGSHLGTEDDFRDLNVDGICKLAGFVGATSPISYSCASSGSQQSRHNGNWLEVGSSGTGWCQNYGVDWVDCIKDSCVATERISTKTLTPSGAYLGTNDDFRDYDVNAICKLAGKPSAAGLSYACAAEGSPNQSKHNGSWQGVVPIWAEQFDADGNSLGYGWDWNGLIGQGWCETSGVDWVDCNTGVTCPTSTSSNCGANTCTGSQCWDNLAWVNGTKDCIIENQCQLSTCSTQTCFNNFSWVQGTKNCAANGVCGSSNGQTLPSAPATNLCADGSLPAVSGAGPWTWTCLGSSGGSNAPCSANKTPDNSCAAITCGLPAPAQICWNGSAFVSGTKDCRVSNGCEANICSSKICFNGIIWAAGTKPQSYSNQTCNTIQTLDCSLQSNCGKTNTVTKACIGTDNCTGDNNASIPGQCGAGCDSVTPVSCPACPNQATTGTWTEVQP